MKFKFLLVVISTLAMVFLPCKQSNSLGWIEKAKQPSAEIISATHLALSQRLLAKESQTYGNDVPNYLLLYLFHPKTEKCSICQPDISTMFEFLLFKSKLASQGKIGLVMITAADSETTVEYLTLVVAQVFGENNVDPSDIESSLQNIHLVIVCSEDFSEIKATKLPVIGIIDITKEEDESAIYLSSGSAGPWSNFDQLILSQSIP